MTSNHNWIRNSEWKEVFIEEQFSYFCSGFLFQHLTNTQILKWWPDSSSGVLPLTWISPVVRIVKCKYCKIILIYSRYILPHTSKISRTTKGSTSKCPNCLQEGHFKRINYIIVYILYHGRLMISLLSWWVFQYSYQPSSQ